MTSHLSKNREKQHANELWSILALWSIKISCVKIDRNCNFKGSLHHPFWLQLLWALFSIIFQLLQLLSLAKDH